MKIYEAMDLDVPSMPSINTQKDSSSNSSIPEQMISDGFYSGEQSRLRPLKPARRIERKSPKPRKNSFTEVRNMKRKRAIESVNEPIRKGEKRKLISQQSQDPLVSQMSFMTYSNMVDEPDDIQMN